MCMLKHNTEQRQGVTAIQAAGTQGKWKLQGHTTYQGLDIAIENKKGSTRSGKEPSGKAWSIKMPFDYGYIKGTEGKDGDEVDCFLGPDKNASHVFIIHQHQHGKDKYDEDKVMLGWDVADQALKAYHSAYNNVDLFTSMTMLSIDDFKEKLKTRIGAKIHAASKGWIGFDLDGTLAEYTEYKADEHIGAPIQKIIRLVKMYLRQGKIVKIFTARADSPVAVKAIKKWCKHYIGRELPVTNVKDKDMELLYDDRAKQVTKNTGEVHAAQGTNPQKCNFCQAKLNGDDFLERKGKIACPDCADAMDSLNAGGPGSGRHPEGGKNPDGSIAVTIKKDPEFQFNGTWHVYIGNHYHQMYRDPASTNWYEDKETSGKGWMESLLSTGTKKEAVNELVMTHIKAGDLEAGGPGSGRHRDMHVDNRSLTRKSPTGFSHNDVVKTLSSNEKKLKSFLDELKSKRFVYQKTVKDSGGGNNHLYRRDSDGSRATLLEPSGDQLARGKYNRIIYSSVEAGGPGSGRHPSAIIKDMISRSGKKPYDINNGDCEPFAKALHDKLPGSTIHDYAASHRFVKFEGKYYDAETPEGVKDWKQIPLIAEDKNPSDDMVEDVTKSVDKSKNKDYKIYAGGPGSGRTPYGRKPKVDLAKKIKTLEERRLKERNARLELNKQGLSQRGKPILSAKAVLAKASINVASKAEQDIAEHNEVKLTKALGGIKSGDNSPFDITLKSNGKTYGIEAKALITQKNDKITQKGEAIDRKMRYGKANGISPGRMFTVAVDYRSSKTAPDIYIRKGVGSFRIGNMTKVEGGFKAIKDYIK